MPHAPQEKQVGGLLLHKMAKVEELDEKSPGKKTISIMPQAFLSHCPLPYYPSSPQAGFGRSFQSAGWTTRPNGVAVSKWTAGCLSCWGHLSAWPASQKQSSKGCSKQSTFQMWIPSGSSHMYAIQACHCGSHIHPLAPATSSRTQCPRNLTLSLCSLWTPSLTHSHNLLLLDALFTKCHVSIKGERTFLMLSPSHGIWISLNERFWQSYITANTAC